MKSRFIVAAVCAAFAPVVVFAQAGATPPKPMSDMHHAASSGWKELAKFHEHLAAAWHPLEHGSDFKPVREHAKKLADAAKAWKESKAPAGCDSKEVLAGIDASVTKSREVADLVEKKAPEAEIKMAMKSLHDGFEAVEMGCKPKK